MGKYRWDERHRGSGIGRSRCGSYGLDADENDGAGARFIARCRLGAGLSEFASGRDRLGPVCVRRRAAVLPPPRGRRNVVDGALRAKGLYRVTLVTLIGTSSYIGA